MREATLSRLRHPETLRLGDGERVLIEDPVADRLAKGDGTLGWEGDDRLALYVNARRGLWELFRLERDNQYRLTMTEPGFVGGNDVVPRLILRLLAHDTRRGFDPHAVVLASHAAKEKASDARLAAESEDLADRLAFGLTKDGVG